MTWKLLSHQIGVQRFVSLATAGIFGYFALPHHIPIFSCQRLFDSKEKVPECLFGMFDEVKLVTEKKYGPVFNKLETTLFINKGFSAVSAGGGLQGTSCIGLPKTFLFNSVDDPKSHSLAFKGDTIDWQSNEGRTLCRLLIASEDNIKFTIAHELGHIVNKDWFYVSCFSSCWFWISCQIVINVLKKRNKLFALAVSGLSAFSFIKCYRIVRRKQEYKADQFAGRLGEKFCNGGINYFQKRQEVNLLLCDLDNDGKNQLYDSNGDELAKFNHPSRTDRIKQLIETKKMLSNNI